MMQELFDEEYLRDRLDYVRGLERYKEGRQDGKQEGKAEEKNDIAINLLKIGANTKQQISAATGLSLSEIDQLAAQIKPASV